MNKSKFLLIIFGIIVVTAIILRLVGKEDQAIDNNPVKNSEEQIINNNSVENNEQQAIDNNSSENNEIIISNIIANQLINSPLTVLGWAKGTWFFEASLPVKIVDEKGQIILAHFGTAQSDWMTTEMVPFKSVLEFNSGEALSGYLIISKDNPSGLPENDDSFKIPVRFK